MVAPILAGEGVLGGSRGEFRRIEVKFVSLGVELKSVQIMFDMSGQHGNRLGYPEKWFGSCCRLWFEVVINFNA